MGIAIRNIKTLDDLLEGVGGFTIKIDRQISNGHTYYGQMNERYRYVIIYVGEPFENSNVDKSFNNDNITIIIDSYELGIVILQT